MTGDLVVALCRSGPRATRSPLPAGISPLPGIAVVFACRYDSSPVGPFMEMGVAEPARLGVRPGWCVTAMAATSADARVAGRVSWGLPKQSAALGWADDGDEVRAEWPEVGLVLAARRKGPRFPAWLPLRSLQRRGDGPVLVPGSIRGWLGRARAVVTVEPASSDIDLQWLAGDHPGLALNGARLVVDVARAPLGALSTLRAPRRAPDAGAASMRTSRGA